MFEPGMGMWFAVEPQPQLANRNRYGSVRAVVIFPPCGCGSTACPSLVRTFLIFFIIFK